MSVYNTVIQKAKIFDVQLRIPSIVFLFQQTNHHGLNDWFVGEFPGEFSKLGVVDVAHRVGSSRSWFDNEVHPDSTVD